jgi:phosphomannomutase/phosphoglucomutase
MLHNSFQLSQHELWVKGSASLMARPIRMDYPVHYKTIDIDGVRIVFDDGWGLIRASNTQPALVLRFEALSNERLHKIRSLVEGKLKELTS